MNKKQVKIVFMGTPDFAVPCLDAILKAGFMVKAVVTAPDKPSGRGRKTTLSPVKEFALQNSLRLLQPANLKEDSFVNELKQTGANLFVVVAFRMLPEKVWSIPSMGTFNLHASLLPQYRGAAPINHAIINGEEKTGLTTFFIDDKIDTGEVILQQEVAIGENETFGELHDRMKTIGASLVVKTIDLIVTGDLNTRNQEVMIEKVSGLKAAPKISREFCRIDWHTNAQTIHNFIRGLSPVPSAHTVLTIDDKTTLPIKILSTICEVEKHELVPGTISTDNKKFIRVAVSDGFIKVLSLQPAGKKRMNTADFLNGFKIPDNAFFG